MIEKNTCLVLGAGAAVPYGLPTGSTLKQLILERVATSNDKVNNALIQADYSSVRLKELVVAFRGSRQASIDAFLAMRPEFDRVGMAAIAAVLILSEVPGVLQDPTDRDDDWYQYLWAHLQDGGQARFAENRLSVVSFNYDRSFERFLIDAYSHSFGVGVEAATEEVLAVIPVVKVHGSLGALSARPYSNILDATALKIAASSIRVLSQADKTSPEFEQARLLIGNAEKILFLGCAYHAENMERLGIISDSRISVGTGFQLTPRERNKVIARWGVQTGQADLKTLRFLRETVDLD